MARHAVKRGRVVENALKTDEIALPRFIQLQRRLAAVAAEIGRALLSQGLEPAVHFGAK